MERTSRHLRVATRNDDATARRHSDSKEADLINAFLEADGFEAQGRTCRALLDYWEPPVHLVPVHEAREAGDGTPIEGDAEP